MFVVKKITFVDIGHSKHIKQLLNNVIKHIIQNLIINLCYKIKYLKIDNQARIKI